MLWSQLKLICWITLRIFSISAREKRVTPNRLDYPENEIQYPILSDVYFHKIYRFRPSQWCITCCPRKFGDWCYLMLCVCVLESTIFQLYMWGHIDEEVGPTVWLPRHRHFVGFFNVPFQAPTQGHHFNGYSEKPAPFQSPFTTRIGIRRTYSYLGCRGEHTSHKC